MKQFLSSYAYFSVPLFTWLAAQLIKLIAKGLVMKDWDWRYIYRSGGMPSVHTTVIVALCTTLAYKSGTRSPDFGIACILAAIVMYDAMNVRHAVGEHSEALRAIMPEVFKSKPPKMIIHQSNGHTPAEVLAGLVLGIIIPIIIFAIA